MGKNKVLVKVQPEGKYSAFRSFIPSFLQTMLTMDGQVVDIAGDIDIATLKPTLRVALRSDSYTLHKILPNKVDPLVSLMMVEKVPDSTYEMVGGLDKQIKEIKEVIELPVKHPELFEALGIAQPKGVLLYGPPGTGKTLLARAVAHHTDCKFIRVSGSELVQKYIGEGSRMVRELFVMAREHAPSIIFMDEIDSIGSSRGESGSGGGDSEVQRTMLELLNQLDGFESTKNIKVIMATNRIGARSRIRSSRRTHSFHTRYPRFGTTAPRAHRPQDRVSTTRAGGACCYSSDPFPQGLCGWSRSRRVRMLKWKCGKFFFFFSSLQMSLQRGINLRALAEKMGQCSGAEVRGICTEAGSFLRYWGSFSPGDKCNRDVCATRAETTCYTRRL